MIINATNITLDCQGYRISGDGVGDTAVFIRNVNNTVVRRCVINGFDYGIYSNGSFGIITNNTVNLNEYNIVLDRNRNNTVANNTVSSSRLFGIWIYSSRFNKIYNNLFNNTNNFWFTGTIFINYWNTTRQNGTRIYSLGTEIGGNYWTNPRGTGYSDNCIDRNRDGFCDNFYQLSFIGPNSDYLPLSNQWLDRIPPVITVISPQNTTYGSSQFWANISLSEAGSVAYYSLNGGPNQSLTRLSRVNNTYFYRYISTNQTGSNNIIFYANDTSGNWGVSDRVYFTVLPPAIPGCPFTINTPGDYVLNQNLTSTGTCITINSNGVTVDCRGYSISGADIEESEGIHNAGDNVTVRNCVINDYWAGIVFWDADYGMIENSIINSCSEIGIYLNRASNNVIRNNMVGNNALDGIQLYNYANNNMVENNTIQFNREGIYIDLFSDRNSIISNRMRLNGWTGITLGATAYNIIRDNVIELNNWGGIALIGITWPPSDNKIFNNLLNNIDNVLLYSLPRPNEWNTTRQPGTRIYSPGTEIGGNYWTNPSGNGYSDTCNDSDTDGFCDNYYVLEPEGPNIDYLPLSDEYVPRYNSISYYGFIPKIE